MKSVPIAALVAALALPLWPAAAHAELAFNVGVVSDYRFRGISQTRAKPTLQGGVDYSNGPLYVGVWASGIKWIKDVGGDAGVEVDLYAGLTGDLTPDLAYDVGVLTYQYPGNKLSPSANTTELYGSLAWNGVKLKWSQALTDTFGNLDSKNSHYVELGTSFDLGGGFSLAPHLGYQKIRGPLSGAASYTDYSLTLGKDVAGVALSLALVGTDADKGFYSSPVNGKVLGKTGLVLGAKFAF